MRVLVAGATGSLGRHVLAVLQQRGHYTRALSRHLRSSLSETYCTISDALQGWRSNRCYNLVPQRHSDFA